MEVIANHNFEIIMSNSKNKTITQKQKQWFRNTYISYKKRNVNIIYSMRLGSKRKKEIDWDIFTREGLIKIVERYKEITKDKKKKEKMKETKKLDLQVFNLVILLGISKSGYYNNRKVTSKSKRDPQLELIITMAFYTNKKIYGRKRIAKYIEQTNNIKVSDSHYRQLFRNFGTYLGALGLI